MTFASDQIFSLRGHLQYLVRHVGQDWDAFTLVDGYEGAGKSWWSIILAWNYSQMVKQLTGEDHEFSVKPIDDGGNMAYAGQGPEVFLENKDNFSRYDIVLPDELIWWAFSRRSMTESSKVLVEVLMSIRGLGLAFVGNIPGEDWADIYLRGHRARFRDHVKTKRYRDEQGLVNDLRGYTEFKEYREARDGHIYPHYIGTFTWGPPGGSKIYRDYKGYKDKFNAELGIDVTGKNEKRGDDPRFSELSEDSPIIRRRHAGTPQ